MSLWAFHIPSSDSKKTTEKYDSKWIWRWLNGLLYQKNPWFGDRTIKPEIEALEILQTWQQ